MNATDKEYMTLYVSSTCTMYLLVTLIIQLSKVWLSQTDLRQARCYDDECLSYLYQLSLYIKGIRTRNKDISRKTCIKIVL